MILNLAKMLKQHLAGLLRGTRHNVKYSMTEGFVSKIRYLDHGVSGSPKFEIYRM
jgi:hypothetical protein